MKKYMIKKRTLNGWKYEYKDFECDTEAMIYARTLLDEIGSMVTVYRHEDNESCGIKQFVTAYVR